MSGVDYVIYIIKISQTFARFDILMSVNVNIQIFNITWIEGRRSKRNM